MTDPRAVVREVDGQLVLDDPDAAAMIRAVGKHNCRLTFEGQADRIAYFERRIGELGRTPDDTIIVLLNVDDVNGKDLADILMPNNGREWQAMRDQGQVPFARGLAARDGIQAAVAALDEEAGEKLRAMVGVAAVVVVDHGVVEAFEA